MPVNLDKPHLWKPDIARSVDMYNDWFMLFAPAAFRETRSQTARDVAQALKLTRNLDALDTHILRTHPGILPALRMACCPPLAVDRLIGLSGASPALVKGMEQHGRISLRLAAIDQDAQLDRIICVLGKLADPDIFVWLGRDEPARRSETQRAAIIVADRLCGAVANPIIRNAQEKRQLAAIKVWLEARGYSDTSGQTGLRFDKMEAGTFSFRLNVPIRQEAVERSVNIPVDAVIMPKLAQRRDMPVFIEAKSAGDYTNTNKRRKEEAVKVAQLRHTYGPAVSFTLFLCGYFDSSYLGYEAAEGIDWVWEHRIDDLAELGL
jgi:type II restriction enzyme